MFSVARHSALRTARTRLRQAQPTAVPQYSAFARLASTFAILEQKEGKIVSQSLAAIAAGTKIGGSVTAFVAGSGVKSAADEAAKSKGVEKVIYVENGAYDRSLPENYAPLLVENIKKGGYTHVVAGHSAFGKNIMPRVSALLDSQQISDITGIESEDSMCEAKPRLGTAFPAPEAEGGNATVEEGVDPKAECQTEWISEDLQKSDRPDLGSAEKVVSGGRGLKSKEEFDKLMPPLADALGAAIGASRAAVDSGFADNSLQVGQTGKNVAPQLYLCAGISGAIQHLAGMKDSKVIAAINKDPEAPIFQVADVGLVGDLFEKRSSPESPLATSNGWSRIYSMMPQDYGEPQQPVGPQEQQEREIQDGNEETGIFMNEKGNENNKKRWWNVWKKWEGEDSDWWFASTGIPLLAATLGPLANVSSIAALVTPWRQRNIIDGVVLTDFEGVPFGDPRWCYWINVASLICGFLGNLFLLLNFTQRIRYIIALPATVILWYLSSGFLIAITICMNTYEPPVRPEETYTQGFWYAIAAAVFYTICSMILMVNMLGYFLGHYPENFALSESQRTLILQTMTFFIWLGGGSAVFAKLEQDAGNESWRFADALYFCDVTILTVGFGDLVPSTDVTRGIVFPYSVGGTITLALIVSSLYTAVRELGDEKIVQKHIDRMRERVAERTVTSSFDLRHREREAHHLLRKRKLGFPRISAPIEPRPFRAPMGETVQHTSALPRVTNALGITSQPKILLLKEEKDRFEAMRKIQADSKRFKQWMALFWSISTFLILWCVGAVVFWITEQDSQDLTYFQSLYFCYVSLLTIGYGDLAPKTNSGRCFFVIWSLIAVPTMTILVSDLGDTVVANFKKWSDEFADFTVLPKAGIWRSFLDKHPWFLHWLQRWTEDRARKKRLKRGFEVGEEEHRSGNSATVSSRSNSEDGSVTTRDPENNPQGTDTASSTSSSSSSRSSKSAPSTSLTHRLALSIQKVSLDLKQPHKRYTYEEWVEFTRLIRATDPERLDRVLDTKDAKTEDAKKGDANAQTEATPPEDENEEGLVNWDWIGDNSPMVSGSSESEWLIERLVESLVRLERRREGGRARVGEREMGGANGSGGMGKERREGDKKEWNDRRDGKEDGAGAVDYG
ncbi:potassium channel [Stemphylium lycopersici]|nr:potassium channel [Stemphylium lycopersici]